MIPESSQLNTPRIVIIGAGPTGLGAAHRLTEIGYTNWLLLEKAPEAGGLAGAAFAFVSPWLGILAAAIVAMLWCLPKSPFDALFGE